MFSGVASSQRPHEEEEEEEGLTQYNSNTPAGSVLWPLVRDRGRKLCYKPFLHEHMAKSLICAARLSRNCC